jgi:hypothetical protein
VSVLFVSLLINLQLTYEGKRTERSINIFIEFVSVFDAYLTKLCFNGAHIRRHVIRNIHVQLDNKNPFSFSSLLFFLLSLSLSLTFRWHSMTCVSRCSTCTLTNNSLNFLLSAQHQCRFRSRPSIDLLSIE